MAQDGSSRQSARDSVRDAVLITEARTSVEEQHRARVRKYLFIMSFRIPALVLAALAYSAWQNPWIAMAIVGASIPLPWMAVLIANDRPPRTSDEPSRYGWSATDSSALEARSHPVVDVETIDVDSSEITSPAIAERRTLH
ncbi:MULTISPECIES: DUF3099 domain-containing protein [unclassified Rhodococcus (in: high G+C Gram-positive bacteria)]|jgi:hypothetical protein|uniref:DUF3099 domain-containing protein n=1 Tax=unclassified Rhodococcus (in: high G+C Gram-positive bacteria) TaxID=192944 RepID=UPI0009EC4D5D|nr:MULTISPECIES: DUF3099 domain-containing protein [unclassified Rhodococcus (in: high G+C Gram-positive bacteria)]